MLTGLFDIYIKTPLKSLILKKTKTYLCLKIRTVPEKFSSLCLHGHSRKSIKTKVDYEAVTTL